MSERLVKRLEQLFWFAFVFLLGLVVGAQLAMRGF